MEWSCIAICQIHPASELRIFWDIEEWCFNNQHLCWIWNSHVRILSYCNYSIRLKIWILNVEIPIISVQSPHFLTTKLSKKCWQCIMYLLFDTITITIYGKCFLEKEACLIRRFFGNLFLVFLVGSYANLLLIIFRFLRHLWLPKHFLTCEEAAIAATADEAVAHARAAVEVCQGCCSDEGNNIHFKASYC